MTRSDVARLLLLAALWGGSFILIRIAVPILGPIVTVELRVAIAGIALLLFARLAKRPTELRRRWKSYLMMGALNCAIPFTLISAAELHLSASMAAILNATSPLFGAVIAALWLKDPLTPRKGIGIVIAILGVIVLVGWSPLPDTTATWLSIGASLLAATFYGLGSTYTRRHGSGAPALGLAVGSQLGSAILMAPAVPFAPPAAVPTTEVVVAIAILSLLCTAFAYLLYYRLIVDVGPTRALTVTFLTPVFGVLWGALFLDEAVTGVKLVACAIILLGTAGVTGGGKRRAGIPERDDDRRNDVPER